MANPSLSPDTLAFLRARIESGPPTNAIQYGGYTYVPVYTGGSGNPETGGIDPVELSNYRRYVGDRYDADGLVAQWFSADGIYQFSNVWNDGRFSLKEFMIPVLAAISMGTLLPVVTGIGTGVVESTVIGSEGLGMGDFFDFTSFDPGFIDPNTVDWGGSLIDPAEWSGEWASIDPGFVDPSTIEWGQAFDPFTGQTTSLSDAVTSGDFARLDRLEVPILDNTTGNISASAKELFTKSEIDAYNAMPKTELVQKAALEQAKTRIVEKLSGSGLDLSPASITKMAGDAMKLASQYATLQNQLSMNKARAGMMLPGGGVVTALANGTRTITYPDGRVVTIPTAVTGQQLIPGIPNQYLMYGALAVCVTLLLRR